MSALTVSFVSPTAAGISVAKDGAWHTIGQLVSPANQALKIRSIDIGMIGTVINDPDVEVRLVRQTTAGTMSSATANLYKQDDGRPESIQSTAQHTATVEPTTTDELWKTTVHPQSQAGKAWPFGFEPIVKGGGRVGIQVKVSAASTNAQNVDFTLEFEE